MTYETFLSIVEKTQKVKIQDAISIVEELYHQANSAQDAIEEYGRIYDLFDLLLQQPSFIGDYDDYHNFAVVCAKEDDFDVACRFLDKGLERYPYCIDLLADYLNYGMQCDRNDICKGIFEKLKLKKNDWNWRAYRFAIDYLINLTSIDCRERDNEILDLIKDFQNKLPDNEDAYLIHAEYLSKKHVNKEEHSNREPDYIKLLIYVTSDQSPARRTPKCDLKLADYYYNNGFIDKAILLLERCKKNSIEVQPSVNRSYVFLLSALCKMSLYYEQQPNTVESNEELAMDVYKNYHIAFLNRKDSRVYHCKDLIESFVRETRIPYPYDDMISNDI